MFKASILLSLYDSTKYLEGYFKNALNQKGIEKIEFSIVHNQPSIIEKKIINKYRNKLNIIYQEVEREPLYKSWNRAIKQSTGEYLVCWNVDDLRTNDSLAKMIETLDNYPNIGFTYGDFIITKNYGSIKGKYISSPEFKKNIGLTSAIGGPFFMWRKNLISKIGYFDEQFLSGGDLDYTIRLSKVCDGKKTKGLLGYFLNDASGLSTRNIFLQIIERTAIENRFNIYSKRNLIFLFAAKRYKGNIIQEFGKERKIFGEKKKYNLKDIIGSIFYTLKESAIIVIRLFYRLLIRKHFQ